MSPGAHIPALATGLLMLDDVLRIAHSALRRDGEAGSGEMQRGVVAAQQMVDRRAVRH